MKNIILLILVAFLGGCAGYRISHVRGTIMGTNIQTPYGPATGNIQYDSITCLGKCPKATMEMFNATR